MAELMDTGDIAKLLGLSREHVTDRLTKRHDFPAPVMDVSQRLRRWAAADVRAWAGLKVAPQSAPPSPGSRREEATADHGAR